MDCRQCLRGLERPKFPEVLKGPRGPRGLRFLEDPGDPEGPEGSQIQSSAYFARGLRAKNYLQLRKGRVCQLRYRVHQFLNRPNQGL